MKKAKPDNTCNTCQHWGGPEKGKRMSICYGEQPTKNGWAYTSGDYGCSRYKYGQQDSE